MLACTPPPNSGLRDFMLPSQTSALRGAFTLQKWARATSPSSSHGSYPSRAKLPLHITIPHPEEMGAPKALGQVPRHLGL